MINLFIVAIGTRVSATIPDIYPQWLSLTVIILVSWLCIYITHKSIQRPLNKVEDRLRLMAKGYTRFNFSEHDLKRKDEIGALNQSVMTLSNELGSIMRTVQDVSLQINQASIQLKTTSDDLSSSAGNEAISIEEISASMEEMVNSIAQNSDNSSRTSNIAENARESIRSSNYSAHEAIEALNRIDEKIKLINDIALQTNILSLNAAVEAARSKENSSGFAVVAAEVRKLADLSKDAALEIKKLSNEASDISQNASNQLGETVALINETSDLVSLIYKASSEQDLGARQINNAINEMNIHIQASATTAEEMSASAEELQHFSDTLRENTGFFKATEVAEAITSERKKKPKFFKKKKYRFYKKAS
ncbi:MAG: hypothetical protein JXR50_05665 [Prolixibacteraceae bacterium]|nr:hypothetical protein [Prolixibacteraceae bacterium]MBN2649213.1 hypothetical protein [Prolixibacteraceae bacterium]